MALRAAQAAQVAQVAQAAQVAQVAQVANLGNLVALDEEVAVQAALEVAVEVETVAEASEAKRIQMDSHQTPALASDSTENPCRWESPRKLNPHLNIRQ